MCKLGAMSKERLNIEVKFDLIGSYAVSIGTITDDLEWP